MSLIRRKLASELMPSPQVIQLFSYHSITLTQIKSAGPTPTGMTGPVDDENYGNGSPEVLEMVNNVTRGTWPRWTKPEEITTVSSMMRFDTQLRSMLIKDSSLSLLLPQTMPCMDPFFLSIWESCCETPEHESMGIGQRTRS
jgi:hypothetical protein